MAAYKEEEEGQDPFFTVSNLGTCFTVTEEDGGGKFFFLALMSHCLC